MVAFDKPCTVNYVNDMVSKIKHRADAGEHHLAHFLEKALWWDTLKSISLGEGPAADLASAALRTSEIAFNREFRP